MVQELCHSMLDCFAEEPSSSSTPPQQAAMAVYQDKYCQLTDDQLEIYTYYFPTYSSIFIPLSTITTISIFRGPVYRIHGSGDFVHWWAADLNRFGKAIPPGGYITITVRDDSIIKSFSCENAETLIALILHGRPGIRRE